MDQYFTTIALLGLRDQNLPPFKSSLLISSFKKLFKKQRCETPSLQISQKNGRISESRIRISSKNPFRSSSLGPI